MVSPGGCGEDWLYICLDVGVWIEEAKGARFIPDHSDIL